MTRIIRQAPRDLFLCLSLSLATAAAAQLTAAPKGQPATEIEAEQRACDGAIRAFSIDAPVDQLLPTHGVYVEGYGAVFITDVNLISLPPLWGFGGHIAPGEFQRIHDTKLKRVPAVRQLMTQMLLDASKSLTRLTPDESILLHFNFYYMSQEDRGGLPKSMSVQGKKKDLLDAAAGKVPAEGVSGILKIRVE